MEPENENYPHIEAMMDALAINDDRDKVVELLEKLAIVLSTVGIGLDALEDEENELIDKERLSKVVAIAMVKLDDLMDDIILESANES